MKEYKRRIVNGKGAAYINIPKKLMESMGWEIGDSVYLFPNSSGIFLSTPKVYTLGYEGLSLKKFKEILKKYRIQQVIDVRNTPWSANPVFRSGYLDKVLEEAGIFYYNIPRVGAPKSLRNIITSDGYEAFFEKYRRYLRNQRKAFKLLMKLINNGRTLLLCYEKDWNICHRKIIAEELEKRGYEVVHIEH